MPMSFSVPIGGVGGVAETCSREHGAGRSDPETHVVHGAPLFEEDGGGGDEEEGNRADGQGEADS